MPNLPPIVDKFLGNDYSFWVELKQQLYDTNCEKWINRCCELSAKVKFYETLLDEANAFRNRDKNA
jgi:hypothetical protein